MRPKIFQDSWAIAQTPFSINRPPTPLANFSERFNDELINELKTLPWRTWSLDYVFTDQRPNYAPDYLYTGLAVS